MRQGLFMAMKQGTVNSLSGDWICAHDFIVTKVYLSKIIK